MFKRNKQSGPQDGRKYRLALIFAGVMFLAYAISGSNVALQSMFSQLITGIGALYLTYCTGNISNKHILGKHGKLMNTADFKENSETTEEK